MAEKERKRCLGHTVSFMLCESNDRGEKRKTKIIMSAWKYVQWNRVIKVNDRTHMESISTASKKDMKNGTNITTNHTEKTMRCKVKSRRTPYPNVCPAMVMLAM